MSSPDSPDPNDPPAAPPADDPRISYGDQSLHDAFQQQFAKLLANANIS